MLVYQRVHVYLHRHMEIHGNTQHFHSFYAEVPQHRGWTSSWLYQGSTSRHVECVTSFVHRWAGKKGTICQFRYPKLTIFWGIERWKSRRNVKLVKLVKLESWLCVTMYLMKTYTNKLLVRGGRLRFAGCQWWSPVQWAQGVEMSTVSESDVFIPLDGYNVRPSSYKLVYKPQ